MHNCNIIHICKLPILEKQREMNMNYKIMKACSKDVELLQNLLQFYIYDFSEFIDIDVTENGIFREYPIGKYFTETGHFPYLLLVEGKYAGFVLVQFVQEERKSYFTVAEFFIMKKYRREGLGKLVAKEIFQLHKGSWEVFQMSKNKPAQNFWRNVINDFTSGKYSERVIEGKRVTQEFSSDLS